MLNQGKVSSDQHKEFEARRQMKAESVLLEQEKLEEMRKQSDKKKEEDFEDLL